ncbi:MAG: energy-coupling factor ABC transporter ATP-binding protein [Cellulomonas sp.]|uniref:ABC transporter ATP-binding protein n=1 Tax=Cellulomonas sp. TaxID=40001 RepID=UPI002584C61B|nr:ABC transporter ATP-binding protein [Cellulomonas sp.]MCR6703855.1 energy-coupling factor ABC transporter ATP-binding protein [Cellulomonas sp.]
MIDTTHLSVAYPGRAPVVRDLTLHVDAGERLLLLGPSGSGKSTLLRLLAGVVPQLVDADVTGQALVAGHDATTTEPAALARHVGTLTQNPADQLCLPTVEEEVAFPLENRAWPPERISPAVERALARVGAAHLRHRRTAELSGGEGQRVALAATLVADPGLLLLDEPTALLDPAAARTVGRLLAPAGGAQVLVEHRLDEHLDLPGRTAVLDEDGRLVADGPTREVLHDQAGLLSALGVRLPGAPPTLRRTPRPAATGSVLRVRGLGVRRGGRDVLTGVDLDVRPGRVTAVVGLNGSGKSTLLLALAGLLPHEGTVDGGSVGLVFQQPEQQFLARTASDEVAWGPRRAKVPDAERVAREALASVHLTPLADADPFRLSGGQQRRLSVAAAAVCGHDVLLADEPTFGQDGRTGAALAALLRSLADEGHGVVVVTHDLTLVADLADDLVVLGHGRVLAQGPAADLLSPAHDGPLHAAGLVAPGARAGQPS